MLRRLLRFKRKKNGKDEKKEEEERDERRDKKGKKVRKGFWSVKRIAILFLILILLFIGAAFEHYFVEPILNEQMLNSFERCVSERNLLNDEINACYLDVDAAESELKSCEASLSNCGGEVETGLDTCSAYVGVSSQFFSNSLYCEKNEDCVVNCTPAAHDTTFYATNIYQALEECEPKDETVICQANICVITTVV
jgi:hypothetical protein